LIYEASGANKLMESELLRLRGELRESDLGAKHGRFRSARLAIDGENEL
jgi:hypothetical protein